MSDTNLSNVRSATSVSLNALRAFESAARHLSFTGAAGELSVTQAAISHQVKGLEERLGVRLFRRTPRGLVVTDEGLNLLPTLNDVFERLNKLVSRFEGGHRREVLTVGVVGTFAVGWLLPRLPEFKLRHPLVDLRIQTHNNRVDMAGESLDLAIRFGDGAWHGIEAERILDAPLTVVCAPSVAAELARPEDLRRVTMLRSYRLQDWLAWLEAAGVPDLPIRGPVFDSSPLMVQAAVLGHGAALVPAHMFDREFAERRLVRPFTVEVETGAYWLARLNSRPVSGAMAVFRDWIRDCAETPTSLEKSTPEAQ